MKQYNFYKAIKRAILKNPDAFRAISVQEAKMEKMEKQKKVRQKMSELLKVLEKQESPRMTDSEYREFLKKQKLEAIKGLFASVGYVLFWVILFITIVMF